MFNSSSSIPMFIIVSGILSILILTEFKHQDSTRLVTSVRTSEKFPFVNLRRQIRKKLKGENIHVPGNAKKFMKVRINILNNPYCVPLRTHTITRTVDVIETER